MAIRIFFKHLFTSIRKRPMQPILLILVIALSVAVGVTAFHTRIFLKEESELAIAAKNGTADFTVTFSSESPMRFLFEDDIVEALDDERAVVCGAFTVPVYYGDDEEFYYGIATDFNTVSKIFDVSFVEYSQFHKNQVDSSVFVSRKFVEETGVKLGGEINLKIINNVEKFTVVGISQNDLLGECDVMIDITTLVGTIAQDSLFVTLLGEDFVPSTKVFVSVDGDVDAAIAKIYNVYDNVIATKVTHDETLEKQTKPIVMLIIALAVCFTLAVIYVCFAVLTAQRQAENALFYAAGAKSYMLNALSVAEMFIYWLIGGLIGIGLSYPVAEFFIAIGNFKYCEPNITEWTLAASLAITLCAAEGSMCLFMFVESRHKKKAKKIAEANKEKYEVQTDQQAEVKENVGNDEITKTAVRSDVKKVGREGTKNYLRLFLIVLTTLSLAFGFLSIIENVTTKTIFGIVGIFGLLVAVFIGTKYLFPRVAHALSNLKKLPVTLKYAIKNASKVESLANTASVVALLLIVMGAVGTLLTFSIKSAETDTNYFVGEYMLQNITESGLEKLKNADNIEDVYSVYIATGIYDENTILTLFSANDAKGFLPHVQLDELPHGNQLYMCEEYALSLNLHIGDEFTLTINGVEYEFVLAKFSHIGGAVFFINFEDMGFSPTYYEVVGKEGLSDDEVKQSIVSELTFESAVILPTTAMTTRYVENANRYTTCIEFISIFLLLFSIIGIADSIVSSYKSRKDEFACYASAGMNKAMLKKLKSCEIAFAFLFAIVIAVVSFVFAFGDLHQIIRSFTVNIFYVF